MGEMEGGSPDGCPAAKPAAASWDRKPLRAHMRITIPFINIYAEAFPFVKND